MSAAQQYLGSKLCIISKASMRYEGVLHSIDPVKATLTLANVKSYGTENRHVDSYVGPSEKVYGLISFKGSDLKDIYMCDNEKKSEIPDPAIIDHSDSIRPGSASSNISYSNLASTVGRAPVTGGQPTFVPTPIGMPPSSFNVLSHNNEVPNHENSNLNQQSLPSSRSVSPLMAHHRRKSPNQDQATQMTPMEKGTGQRTNDGATKYNNATKNLVSKHTNVDTYQYHQQFNRRDNYGSNNNNNGNHSNQGGHKPMQNQFYPSNHHYHQNRAAGIPSTSLHNNNMNKFGYAGNRTIPSSYMPSMGPPRYHNYQSYNRGGASSAIGSRAPGHTGRIAANSKGPLSETDLKQFTEEFDFEEMNAQFNKESLHKEFEEKLKLDTSKKSGIAGKEDIVQAAAASDSPAVETEQHPEGGTQFSGGGEDQQTCEGEDKEDEPAPICYDKAKSFFDNISCQTNKAHFLIPRGSYRQPFPHQKLNTETFGGDSGSQQQQSSSAQNNRAGRFNRNYANANFDYNPFGRNFYGGGGGGNNSYRFGYNHNYGGGHFGRGGGRANDTPSWSYGQNASRRYPAPSTSAVKVGGSH